MEILSGDPLVQVTETAGCELEFFPANVGKLRGAVQLLDRLGMSLEESMCIGDGTVDAPLIGAVGIGVAMGNAPERVKAKAGYETARFDEEGAALAIERFLL